MTACSDAAVPTPVVLTSLANPTRSNIVPIASTPTAPQVPTPVRPTAIPTAPPVPPTATLVPPTSTPLPTATPVPPARDGRWLAYIAQDSTLYVSRADGSSKRKIDINIQSVLWSPDGTHFIFYRATDGYLYIADYNGANPHQLTNIKGFGKWLPSGKNILLPPATTTSRQYNIISDTDGKVIRNFELPSGYINQVFDLSPDGTSLIYSRVTPGTAGGLLRPVEYHIFDLNTRQDKLLAANLAEGLAVWNVDFTEIIAPDTKDNNIKAISLKTAQSRILAAYSQLFSLKRDQAGFRLFWANPLSTVRLDGTVLKKFSDATLSYPAGGIPAYYFNVATDGNSVIYADAGTKENGGGVYQLEVTTGRLNRVADNDITNPAAELFAGASQDNKLLAFTVRTTNPAVYTIRQTDTGKEVGQVEGLPVWQP